MRAKRNVVVGSTPWAREAFDSLLADAHGEWTFVTTHEELLDELSDTKPRYIFFFHWSTLVPAEIVAAVECVCFHMTDLPYGRGGSPLQNLLERGHTDTMLTAFRMDEGLDTGPVYQKRPLSLHSSAEEIYLRAAILSAEMAQEIVETEPTPIPQTGDVALFRRRTPQQSRIPTDCASIDDIHRHIRMLDAEGYPPAFIDYGGFRFEFRRATRATGRVEADVTITPLKDPT